MVQIWVNILRASLLHGYNVSRRSRVGVGMNRSARGWSVKRFERSNWLDTGLHKTYLYLFFIFSVVTTTTPATTTTPPATTTVIIPRQSQTRVTVTVRLTSVTFTADLVNKSSTAYTTLKTDVVDAVIVWSYYLRKPSHWTLVLD